MREFFVVAGVLLAVFVGVGIIVGAPLAWLASAQCESQAHKMELDHSWGMIQECMVRVDGKWVLLRQYRVPR